MHQELDKQCAYYKGNPMRNPEDMHYPLHTQDIESEWEQAISKMWWYRKNKKIAGISDVMYNIRDKLLSFGGHNACMPMFDGDAVNIFNRGQLWLGDRVYRYCGQFSQCHRNAARIWKKHSDKYVLCTGYALSDDGMWRSHTWLVEPRKYRSRIIETTELRTAYFGFALLPEEAQDFYIQNN